MKAEKMPELKSVFGMALGDFYGNEINYGDKIIAMVDLWGEPEHGCRIESNGNHDGVRGYAFFGEVGLEKYQFILTNMICVDPYYLKRFARHPIQTVPLRSVSQFIAKVSD